MTNKESKMQQQVEVATNTGNSYNKDSNDREANFLASQQARLDKIRNNAEQNNSALLHGDQNIQQQRKEFWIIMKSVCSTLHSSLSDFIGVDTQQTRMREEEKGGGEGDKEMSSNESSTEKKIENPLYVTAQQRNEALSKLQEIQFTIRCLSHYTLHSSKFTPEEEKGQQQQQQQKYLPLKLVGFTMPELPTADLRLLNIEIQNLNSKAQEVQNIVMPKEKFRFRRYRQAMQNRTGMGMDETEQISNTVIDLDEGINDDGIKLEESTRIQKNLYNHFDGVSLVDKKDCFVKVHHDGQFTTSTTKEAHDIVSSQTQSTPEAKAFLIRDLDSCHILVEGSYSSIHIIRTKNTTIHVINPIAGPVHVTGCIGTNITLKFCRQLRIHDCTNVSFNIHVASGPIIEGCKGMKFYQRDYVSSSDGKDDTGSHLDNFETEENLYWDVKDFHWLKNLVKSPNFTVISEEEQRKEEAKSTATSTGYKTQKQKVNFVQNDAEVPNTSIIDNNNDDDDSSDDDEL